MTYHPYACNQARHFTRRCEIQAKGQYINNNKRNNKKLLHAGLTDTNLCNDYDLKAFRHVHDDISVWN